MLVYFLLCDRFVVLLLLQWMCDRRLPCVQLLLLLLLLPLRFLQPLSEGRIFQLELIDALFQPFPILLCGRHQPFVALL